MKKHFWAVFIAVTAFVAGFSINNIAISDQNPDYKVAIVDLQQIVSNSTEIRNLKAEQERKISTMQTIIDKARHEIANEKDPAKVKALEEKYLAEINQQKLALDGDYNTKLNAIDRNIRNIVVEKARAMNYDLVVPKNMILFGGDDITEQVSSSIK